MRKLRRPYRLFYRYDLDPLGWPLIFVGTFADPRAVAAHAAVVVARRGRSRLNFVAIYEGSGATRPPTWLHSDGGQLVDGPRPNSVEAVSAQGVSR